MLNCDDLKQLANANSPINSTDEGRFKVVRRRHPLKACEWIEVKQLGWANSLEVSETQDKKHESINFMIEHGKTIL
jgi:hypothetical protein